MAGKWTEHGLVQEDIFLWAGWINSCSRLDRRDPKITKPMSLFALICFDSCL
ncbi:hypothetical protein BGW36DRAFT_383899 [Talaromyces proteolyticus]|uniref:Uncharacterized protein n=1 Tax=Talaromyces proteolyticus TaxID=1131652 RepID=A0AAD4PXP1_9EURO|nr:uncharacterized protein BGW36DRAFT_383899 [Talaromyces proteolyticus]KAH8693880.1 hypothetical protein BGW36DRAFT_383899 [Talaromyces proteolyticus]